MKKDRFDKNQFIKELSRERVGKIPHRKVFEPKNKKWADKGYIDLYLEDGEYDDEWDDCARE